MYRILEGCPRCKHYPVLLCHKSGPVDWLMYRLMRKRPFRCTACNWRGWANQIWERRQRNEPHGLRLARRADDPKRFKPGV